MTVVSLCALWTCARNCHPRLALHELRIQGLRLGQGVLILGRDARIADQGHQNRPFAISDTTTKRPIGEDSGGGSAFSSELSHLKLATWVRLDMFKLRRHLSSQIAS